MEAIVSRDDIVKLEVGKTYNLVAGIHASGCDDVLYLSNMACIGVNEAGYILQGIRGTVGSLQGSVFVYKDEIFAVFDKDLYECLAH